jgi:hypothetical protein
MPAVFHKNSKSCMKPSGTMDMVYNIFHALNPPPPCREDHTLMAFLPFVGTTFNHIIRVISKHIIKTMGLPARNLYGFL